MTSDREAARVLKSMEDAYHPAVNYLRLSQLGEALENQTGDAWTVRRVKEEFLVPVIKCILDGSTQLDAEIDVWKQLGLVEEPPLPGSDRDFAGRRRTKR